MTPRDTLLCLYCRGAVNESNRCTRCLLYQGNWHQWVEDVSSSPLDRAELALRILGTLSRIAYTLDDRNSLPLSPFAPGAVVVQRETLRSIGDKLSVVRDTLGPLSYKADGASTSWREAMDDFLSNIRALRDLSEGR